VRRLVPFRIAGGRRGEPSSEAATVAATAYLEASRAVDDALERLRVVQLRQETTLDEDEQVERSAGDCWEALFLAAIEFDAFQPDPEDSAAASVRVMAQLHNPPPCWSSYHLQDGSRSYDDGRGRTIALLTADGEVVPGPWFKQRQALPPPPR
jgi:hypothetical protein